MIDIFMCVAYVCEWLYVHLIMNMCECMFMRNVYII